MAISNTSKKILQKQVEELEKRIIEYVRDRDKMEQNIDKLIKENDKQAARIIKEKDKIQMDIDGLADDVTDLRDDIVG